MLVAALVLTGLAALVHGYIFVLESFLWTTPQGRATFATSVEQAESSKELAYNQGFYNLFLALAAVIGIVLVATGTDVVGRTLIFAGAGSMVLAALVLVTRNPRMARAAAIQGALPLLAVVTLLLS